MYCAGSVSNILVWWLCGCSKSESNSIRNLERIRMGA